MDNCFVPLPLKGAAGLYLGAEAEGSPFDFIYFRYASHPKQDLRERFRKRQTIRLMINLTPLFISGVAFCIHPEGCRTVSI